MAEYHYKKPRREIAQREIRRLIIDEGLSNNQLSERLNIPLRSVERYISQLYSHDKELLSSLNSTEHTFNQTRIKKDRMDHYRQEILESIARNPDFSAADRIKAWNIVCELEAADLRLLDNCMALVARSSALPVRNVLMLKQSQQQEQQREEGGGEGGEVPDDIEIEDHDDEDDDDDEEEEEMYTKQTSAR